MWVKQKHGLEDFLLLLHSPIKNSLNKKLHNTILTKLELLYQLIFKFGLWRWSTPLLKLYVAYYVAYKFEMNYSNALRCTGPRYFAKTCSWINIFCWSWLNISPLSKNIDLTQSTPKANPTHNLFLKSVWNDSWLTRV